MDGKMPWERRKKSAENYTRRYLKITIPPFLPSRANALGMGPRSDKRAAILYLAFRGGFPSD